jgi:Malectin domain
MFWQRGGVMGGETRPELQSTIFTPDYPAGTENHQDFAVCSRTTHCTYLLHHDAFINGGYTGETLVRARHAHARLGYQFEVKRISVRQSSEQVDCVDFDVRVEHTGVAPFYYPLCLALTCPETSRRVDDVQTILIENGQSHVFTFKSIPATEECLKSVQISLDSPYAYPERPIRFSQGTDGTVKVQIPTPTLGSVLFTLPSEEPRQKQSLRVSRTESARHIILIEAQNVTDGKFQLSEDTELYSVTTPITGAEASGYDPELFQCHRWANQICITILQLDAGGTYRVSLGFCETFHGTAGVGKRVMNVLANNKPIVSRLDVYNRVGFETALVESSEILADRDGKITIQMVGVVENAFFSFMDVWTG